MTDKTKVSFIAIGTQGRPMIFQLLEKGYTLKVQDKYNNKQTVVASGAIWEDYSKKSTRDCWIHLPCLPLLQNMSGKNGSIKGINKSATEKYYYRYGKMILDFR